MTVDNGVRIVAGTFVLISLALGLKVNPCGRAHFLQY